MKNLPYVINGILAVAIIVLFVLFFTSNKNCSTDAGKLSFENDSTVFLPVAYVNVDSLLLNYNFAKEANENLMKKVNSTENTLAKKRREIENEQAEFQRKVQKNVFLTEEKMQQEYNRISKLATDFQNTAQRMSGELDSEQQQMTMQISDSIRTCIEQYNKTANYQMIFLNNGHDNIIVSKDKYDITNNILTILNSRHADSKK